VVIEAVVPFEGAGSPRRLTHRAVGAIVAPSWTARKAHLNLVAGVFAHLLPPEEDLGVDLLAYCIEPRILGVELCEWSLAIQRIAAGLDLVLLDLVAIALQVEAVTNCAGVVMQSQCRSTGAPTTANPTRRPSL